jgi:hypothetical protein
MRGTFSVVRVATKYGYSLNGISSFKKGNIFKENFIFKFDTKYCFRETQKYFTGN